MSDFDGGAAAPAESAPAPAAPVEGVSTPNPISTGGEPAKAEPEAKEAPKPISAREALQKAAEKVESEAKDKPADKAAPVKSEASRDPTGKFAPKDGEPAKTEATEKPVQADPQAKAAETTPKPTQAASDAPARFSSDAKAAWATAPEPVRAEVARMEREMSAGLEKYRAGHDEYEAVKDFAEMAKRGGTNLRTALETYAGLEQMIDQNPIGALEKIAQMKGFSLRQVAEHVLGKDPDQASHQRDQEMIGLKQTIAHLQQQIGGVTQTFQKQQSDATLSQVQEFAAKNPRFDELADDIGFFIQSGRTKDLSEAYSLAERLNPAPASAPNPAPGTALAPALDAQTIKGSKSINGAPTPGSDPAVRQPSSSIRDAIRQAAARAG